MPSAVLGGVRPEWLAVGAASWRSARGTRAAGSRLWWGVLSGGAEDFALVARLSDEIHAQRVEERTDPYAASPFGWIRQEASATRGSIAALMVRRWAEEVGLPTADRTNSDHDLRINGLKIEVKLSTLWSGTSFKFQQIRDRTTTTSACSA